MRFKMLVEIEKIHDEAMELLDQAHIALLNKNHTLALQMKQQAFEKEREASNRLSNEDIEPSRSILYRSAASIALDLGFYKEAEKLACAGLMGNPPEWVENELRDIFNKKILK